ncbi:hypothetical protein LTR10_014908 [Elasticomyces elasticus]|uniref:FAM86 N-terminal domain-containing protein n=1 Tax=Exophiala sideris TaxID=1016849 RepID=A0ABR0JFN2_9EURO|nr:hypothetical protein LTR10_014908 [Elasticomyces elasticus]KAK5025752.1 hypothetical protein LTS07_007956 [Exophiala sideris]KAK5033040.1 hypothetical protein LTR13_007005 [Exophiala sideris]KAK5063525.1 hypothetical protein LTR69_004231 [Exophiala sideris]KAK5180643.1 hypothetical protein LTR44_006957 [Eurotiomycetes sp. CCFEE 6388]
MDISRAGTEPLLVKFYRQYMQQINDVTYPPGTLLVNQDVQDILYKYFFDASQNKYLPAARYQARILKHIIREIEKSCKDPEEDQVSDHLMEHMAHLSTIPQQPDTDEAQQLHVHSYFPPLPLDASGVKPVLINEAQNLLSKGNNVGLRTWEAALHLAWYLTTQRPDLVKSRNVLELGAGTGFLSLLCAGHLGASHVLATDGLGHVCEALESNVDLNKSNDTLYGHVPPQVRQLDWTDRPEIDQLLDDTKQAGRQYDLIIGADITYHPDILRPLAELLSMLKDAFPQTSILISATIRSNTFADFVAICRDDLNFKVTELPCKIPQGLQYCGCFHSVATEIKIVSLER